MQRTNGASEPISNEARGKRRIFVKQVADAYAGIDAVYLDLHGDARKVGDFVAKKGLGRQRVFSRIDQRLKHYGARLYTKQLEGKHPVAIWGSLTARESVHAAPDHARDQQDCVCVNYLMLGCSDTNIYSAALSEGLWALEVTDHALGRWFQRARPGGDLREDIFALHRAVLFMQPDQLTGSFKMHVGSGVWAGDIWLGLDEHDFKSLTITVRTFIDFDRVSEQEEKQLIRVNGKFTDTCLGATWLLPAPFHPDYRAARVEAINAKRSAKDTKDQGATSG